MLFLFNNALSHMSCFSYYPESISPSSVFIEGLYHGHTISLKARSVDLAVLATEWSGCSHTAAGSLFEMEAPPPGRCHLEVS